MSSEIKRTCLAETHESIGGRMVDFAGWLMPVQYAGVVDECKAVRGSCGLFDASHMGEIEVQGSDALTWLDQLTTNQLDTVANDQARYTLLLQDDGGVIDDLIIYRLDDDRFIVVCNASNHATVFSHLSQHLPDSGVVLTDRSEQVALIAVQGPEARSIAGQVLGTDPEQFPRRFRWQPLPEQWQKEESRHYTFVARTGYTGEDGVELFVDRGVAPQLWAALMEAGATPCGLGARDVCRIEAGLPLYGHEMDRHNGPRAANLMFAVKLEKGDFEGRKALLQDNGQHTIGLRLTTRGVPREGYEVMVNGTAAGIVSSGTYSPQLEAGIAMARMDGPVPADAELAIQIRNRPFPAEQVSLPFIHQFKK